MSGEKTWREKGIRDVALTEAGLTTRIDFPDRSDSPQGRPLRSICMVAKKKKK